MFRHAALGFVVTAVVHVGCSASPSSPEREPFQPDTTRDPASATADASTGLPSDEAPGPDDPRPKPSTADAGKPGPTTRDDAGKPETDDADAGGAEEADAGGADTDDTKDAGAELGEYDPAKGDPFRIERQPVPNDHNWCLNSAFVTPGHYAGDVGQNTNDYANPDRCGDGLPSEGRDAWVKVKVPSGRTISVWGNVKETGDFDAVLYLLAGSCGKLGTCVGGANENLASREHATWTNQTATEATVHVVFDLLLPPERAREVIPYYLDISVR